MSAPTKLGEEYYEVLKVHGLFGLLGGIREKIVDALVLKRGMRVLDVGSGDGLFAITFAKTLSGGKIIGIDNDQDEVLEARKHAESAEAICEFRTMDAHDLEFDNEYFDVVGCFLSLEEICASTNNLERVLAEMIRVLKKEGQIVLGVLTTNEPTQRQKLLRNFLEEFGWKFFEISDFLNILEKKGFSVRCETYDTNLHLKSKEALEFLEQGFGVKCFPKWKAIWKKYEPLVEKLRLGMWITGVFAQHHLGT